MQPKGYKSLNGLWWVYPTATWLGGAIAGFAKHIIMDAHDSLKKSEEYRDSKLAELASDDFNLSTKINLDKSVEEEDKTGAMGLNVSGSFDLSESGQF